MDTISNLIVVLMAVSGLYTILGLATAIAEKIEKRRDAYLKDLEPWK